MSAERLLMVTNTPWTTNLGGARVFVELAAELRELGCQVEKLSAEDAFPRDFLDTQRREGTLARLLALVRGRRDFARQARAFLRREGQAFDIVDAMQADLPFSKRELCFDGLLVSRSVGLFSSYHEFNRFSARRWPVPRTPRHQLHRLIRYPSYRQALRRGRIGFRHADLINVSNGEDMAAVREMGFPSKVAMFPYGLTDARRQAFVAAQRLPRARLEAQTIVFVGTWNSRKGARDWPQIARAVLAERPRTRFLFLGTDMNPEAVLRDFPPGLRQALEVRPRFEGAELPHLLGAATIGAFPGYLEGFGFAVLEMLAAGLPLAAYDASGPREMLRLQGLPTSVERGNVSLFVARVLELLDLSPERYAEHAEDGRRVAERFSWRQIAEETLDFYRERLEKIR